MRSRLTTTFLVIALAAFGAGGVYTASAHLGKGHHKRHHHAKKHHSKKHHKRHGKSWARFAFCKRDRATETCRSTRPLSLMKRTSAA